MKKIFICITFCIATYTLNAQSNPAMDRPIQQCISQNQDKVNRLKPNFSIGSWLGKVSETCDKLKATTGKGGGPQVISLLEMEKDLDELIILADNCPALSKVKAEMDEMKKIYTEKTKSETFKMKDDKNSDGLFDDDKELSTFSLSRKSAGKIKNQAEKIRKMLKK
ncbi:MAG: hypothetical protein EAZ85_07745 [Bacteroidetes bacterium]|nr:MAG: hypothetical protein EAZ85_07745 [Bacteroidota bacterium]TAG90194.1 MAG: hypothetical protein EAZ20_04910 [Bacteroidota bacterium]